MGLQLQGVLNLMDNDEDDGGFHAVSGGHHKLKEWFNEAKEYCEDLKSQVENLQLQLESRDTKNLAGCNKSKSVSSTCTPLVASNTKL